MNHIQGILALLLVLHSGLLQARTLVVAPAGPVQSIKKALDLARPWDTIRIKGGYYREGELTILKPLTIIGENRPVIDGDNAWQPISVRSNHVSISGLKIVRTGNNSLEDWAGIKIYSARYVYIFNNTFEDNYFAVYLSASKKCFITGNTMLASGTFEQTSGNGVHAWKSDSLKITDNTIRGHRDGIYFEFVEHSYIARNHCEDNMRYGLHFMFSHDDYYEGNAFIGNGAGVAVMYSRRVTMLNNRFSRNKGAASYGLLLKDISESTISKNRFADNTSGIFMEGCTRSTFHENTFLKNGWAVRLQASCEDNHFLHNNFFSNTFDLSTNSSQTVANTLEQNYWDKYEGYDLDRNGFGDVPYHPVSLYSMLSDQMPYAMMLWRSFCVYLLDRAEKVIPSISPDNLRDSSPLMTPYDPGTPSQ